MLPATLVLSAALAGTYPSRVTTSPALKGARCGLIDGVVYDCANKHARASAFQEAYLRDAPHQQDLGLTCLDGRCRAKLEAGAQCVTGDNCESGICGRKAKDSADLVCWKVDETDAGSFCPGVDKVCEDGFCDAEEKCVKYAEEGEGCFFYVDGVTGVEKNFHGSCNPMHQFLYCLTSDQSEPTGIAEPVPRRGVCKRFEDVDSDAACPPLPGMVHSYHRCPYDQYCRVNATDPKLARCHDKEGEDDSCVDHAGCNFGYLCNKFTTDTAVIDSQTHAGKCVEIMSLPVGRLASDAAFCEKNLILVDGRCAAPPLGTRCQLDGQCDATPGMLKPQTVFCRKEKGEAEGRCDVWLHEDCEDRFEEHTKFAAQVVKAEQPGGTVFNQKLCWEKSCFALRSLYKLQKAFGERLRCCMLQNLDDDHVFHAGNDVFWLPHFEKLVDLTAWSYYQLDSDSEGGGLCTPLGISPETIGIICAIFGFLFIVMTFVIVREYFWTPTETPEADEEKVAPAEPIAE